MNKKIINDFFSDYSAQIDFKKEMGNKFDYKIINGENVGEFKKSGVWALFGKHKEQRGEGWLCLQVGQTKLIQKEIFADIKLMKFNSNVEEINYVNQFNEIVFRYGRTPTTRERIYKQIDAKYEKLVFVCIKLSNNKTEMKEFERAFATKYHAVFWRNGGSYKTGVQIDINNILCKNNLNEKLS